MAARSVIRASVECYCESMLADNTIRSARSGVSAPTSSCDWGFRAESNPWGHVQHAGCFAPRIGNARICVRIRDARFRSFAAASEAET
eukprot:5288330-Alexandrium_andersonii.AAC.1